MLNTARKRTLLIEQLVSALGLADELGDAALSYLIERALDEARSNQVKALDQPNPED
jgi:hypothetical protein